MVDIFGGDVFARVLAGSNAFDVLGLPAAEAEPAVVKAAFRKAALAVHPDKSSDPRAEQAFKALSKAFETLGDRREQLFLLQALQQRPVAGQQTRPAAPGHSKPKPKTKRQRHSQDADDGPHTTTYYQSEEDARAAKRVVQEEALQAKAGEEQEAWRRAMEERMGGAGWQSGVTTWQAWKPSARHGGRGAQGARPAAMAARPAAMAMAAPAALPSSLIATSAGGATATTGQPINAARPVCWLCRRQFSDAQGLARHEQLSALHAEKLQEQAQAAAAPPMVG